MMAIEKVLIGVGILLTLGLTFNVCDVSALAIYDGEGIASLSATWKGDPIPIGNNTLNVFTLAVSRDDNAWDCDFDESIAHAEVPAAVGKVSVSADTETTLVEVDVDAQADGNATQFAVALAISVFGGEFQAPEQGTLQFSLDYRLNLRSSTDFADEYVFGIVAAGLMTTYDDHYGAYDAIGAAVHDGADSSEMKSDIITLLVDLEAGETASIYGFVGSLMEMKGVTAIPTSEPGTFLLCGSGLIGLAGIGRRFRR